MERPSAGAYISTTAGIIERKFLFSEVAVHTQVDMMERSHKGSIVTFVPNQLCLSFANRGNYRRVPPYSLGEPCSACPDDCDDKLCSE